MPQFMQAKELAKVLGVHPSTIWRWSADGKIPKPLKISAGHSVWDLNAILTILNYKE